MVLLGAGVSHKDVIGVDVYGNGEKVDLKLVRLKNGTSVKIMEPLYFNSEVAPKKSGRAFSGWAMQYTEEVLK